MSEALDFSISINIADLRHFFWFTVWLKHRHTIPILIFATGVGALLLLRGGAQTWCGAALLTAVFLYCYNRLRIWPRFRQSAQDELGEIYEVSVDRHGVCMRNTVRDSQQLYDWSKIIDARELKGHYFLYQAEYSALIIPKRDLIVSQRAAWEHMLRKYLPGKFTYA